MTEVLLKDYQHIFREYDIRGIVNEDLTESIVYDIGRALACHMQKGKQVFIARDGRHSSPNLQQHLSAGICSMGINVVDIGAVPTPLLYYITSMTSYGTGVMITGSHNPSEYNGLKIILNGVALHGNSINSLYHTMHKLPELSVNPGIILQRCVATEYLQTIISKIKLKRKLKIVVDAGSGIAGILAPKLYKMLGCEVIELYCKVDGNFPGHHPDPADPKNLVELQQAVIDNNADIGFAFDGDGDRLGVVDSSAKIIWPDRLLMLFAEDVLAHEPGATVIYDVKSTCDLAPVITKAKGVPLLWKTGHSVIKAKMQQTRAVLAGEMSGHIFCAQDWFGFDDALYAGSRLLRIVSEQDKTTAKLFAGYPEALSTPEISVVVPEEHKFLWVEKIIELVNFPQAKQIITIDGLRVEFAHGWGLLRASNTSAKIMFRFEAIDHDTLTQIKKDFRQLCLQVFPKNINIPF